MLALGLAVAGCAAFDPPRAWEKDILARQAMQFDSDALAERLGRQVYTSKEAGSGGHGVGGGGCGCN
jgi:hypothetical protein